MAATKDLLAELPELPWSRGVGARPRHASAELFAGAEAAEGMDAFLAQAHAVVGRSPRRERAPASRRLAVAGEEFVANAAAPWAVLVGEVRDLHDQVLAGGGPQYVERHRPAAR